MTKEENRPAGCVLRLFGTPEQTVQKAVVALPDTWQGTVHCRTRGAETLVALQSSTPQQLHRAVQLLRTSLAPALYGEGEQTLAAAAVQALEQHRKLLVCSDAAAGALLETRLENLPGAEKVFDFGARAMPMPHSTPGSAASCAKHRRQSLPAHWRGCRPCSG